MINVLIVEENEFECRNLVNTISHNINYIRLYNMSVTGKDAINILNLNKVDIILLDLNLPDISGIDILKHISRNKLKKYLNSVIIISGDVLSLPKISNCQKDYINAIIQKPINYSTLIKKIQKLAQEKISVNNTNTVKSQINYELQKLCFNFSYNGTRYLAELIYELYINQDKYLDIFTIIARRHHKTINAIEGNIKHAINAMFLDCDEKIIIKYFHYNYITKPKLKEISYTVLNKI